MAETLESLAVAVAALKADVERLSKQLGEGRAGFTTDGSPEPIETFRVAAPVSAPDVLIAGRSVEERINAGRADIRRLDELTDGRLSKIEAGEFAGGEWRIAGRVALSTDDGGQNLVLGSAEFETGVNVVGSTEMESVACQELRVGGKLSILGKVFGEPGISVPFETGVEFKQLVKANRIAPFSQGTVEIDGRGLTVAGFVQVIDQLIIGSVLDLSDATAGGIQAEGVIKAKHFETVGGDIAEDIPVAAGVEATPGMVMVITTDGDLVPCDRDHDHRVAGVVAGAGGLETALLMKPGGDNGAPIALAGTAFCNCDARFGAVAPGDLLTTSATPGHARRTSVAEARTGAVIGKALSALDRGCGQVLMLVGHR